MKGRFSYSKTIARAQYGQLFAGSNPGTPNGSTLVPSTTKASGTSNNPALVPLESDNLDLSLEWYFSDTGYVSAGLWEKRVTNFTGNEVVSQTLFGIKDPTAGPDVEAARTYIQTHGSQCVVPRVCVLGRRHVAVHGDRHVAEPVDGRSGGVRRCASTRRTRWKRMT